MKFRVVVDVMPKEGIADPQGQTIERALPALGFVGAEGVRVGKRIALTLEADDAQAARVKALEMCESLLANPVIEDFEVVVES